MIERETNLEQARRHVAEAEMRVAEQVERVKQLRLDGHESAAASGERLLAVFEQSLQAMRDHLALEEQEAQRKHDK